jgi:hypothetical protein
MKTKVNMSKAALLIELGWETINDMSVHLIKNYLAESFI